MGQHIRFWYLSNMHRSQAGVFRRTKGLTFGRVFIPICSLFMPAEKALDNLHICAGLPEP